MEKFSLQKWNPIECKNASEIEQVLIQFDIPGKTISAVHVIGMAKNFRPYDISLIVEDLKKEGFSEEDIFTGRVSGSSKRLPLVADIYEPVVFVFDDGSTLELMNSKFSKAVLVAANQISPYCSEGLNHSNFHSEYFFRILKGMSFSGHVERFVLDPDTVHNETLFALALEKNGVPSDFYAAITCNFSISGNCSEFSFGIKSVKQQDREDYLSVPTEEYYNAAINIDQAYILEGHDPGSVFEIVPYAAGVEDETWSELISIDMYDFEEYLMYFFHKYYDPGLRTNKPERGDGYEVGKRPFDWYGVNGFTAESMRLVLKDIKDSLNMLETDYDNPKLDGLKKAFIFENKDIPVCDIRKIIGPENDEEKRIATIRRLAWIAMDFYRSFVPRIETMMERCHNCEEIVFYGP